MDGDQLLGLQPKEDKLDSCGQKNDNELSSQSPSTSLAEGVELKDVKSPQKDSESDEESECVSMSYEEAMTKYGTGRYQVFLFILLSLVTFSTVFNNNGYIFIGGNQEHKCKVPLSTNWTDSNNQTAFLVYEADTCTYNKSVRYGDGITENFTQVLLEKEIKCDSWDYDQSEFKLTIMSEWDINSCNGKWKTAVANSLYMCGFLIGCIVLANLSDRYGRSKLLLISNVCMAIFGVISSFSVNLWMLAVMRLILGIFTAGARNAGYVYVCEIMKHRGTAGILHGVVYSVGGVIVTAMAQLLRNWRHFQLACALSYLLYIPYYWIMDDSPRWLLSQGRTEEAIKYFKRSGRINKVEVPENLHVYLEYQPKSEGNVLALFKTPNLRNKTLLVSVLWFSVSIVYFGVLYNVGNIAGNIYTNNYLLQAVGLLQFFAMWYIKLGRRIAVSSAFLVACVVFAVVPLFATYGIQAGVIVMSMIGTLFMTTEFELVYVVTAELYPTSARVTALGLGSSVARVGGAISPYLVLSDDLWHNLPYVIFGGIALIAGLIAILLPETKGRKLPDSLCEAESENPLNACCCLKGEENDETTIKINTEQ